MNKDDLKKLKAKLNSLSDEEKKQRDLYLRGLANGELAGPLVGYPSIDKPSLQYYKEVPLRDINRNQTIYDLVFSTNKYNMDDIAIGYLGINWSYTKLKNETDKLADAFNNSGIKMGDVVLIGVSNCPEAVASLLALNKIGAVTKWFDVRAGEKDIEEYANDSNCKYTIIFDMLINKVEKILDNTNLSKVIVIRPTNSLPLLIQKFQTLKEKRNKQEKIER